MKISKKVQDIAFVSFEVAMVVLTIGALIWQDYANTPFWWNFWTYSPIATIGGFIGGLWWKSQQKESVPPTDQTESK